MRKTKFISRTPWVEKMNKPQDPLIKVAPKDWAERYGGAKMLIPTPRAIEKIVRQIPKGSLMTITKLRHKLATEYGADFACPLTTGLFLRILSEYAEEDESVKKKRSIPYWRLIKEDGSLLEKIHGGMKHQAELLSEEGFKLVQQSIRRIVVKDFEKELV